MSNVRPFSMHEAGSIGGVPGPNNGLWPGGVTVYVDMDTMEVVSTSLIGGGSLVTPEVVSEEQIPTDPALPAIQETPPIEEPVEEPAISEPIQEEFPQVTPVENLEEINVQ